MPSPFDITVVANTVTLDNKREGIAAFTVKNNTRRRIRSTARLTVQPASGEKWVAILPPESAATTDTATVRDFPIDSTQQYQIKIAAPPEAPPASYTLKLTLADEVNPDENFTESPEVLFTVREIPKPEPRPFPVWIIPVVVIALIAIAAIVVIGIGSSNNANANATGTAVALANARDAAETATAAALQGAAQQTAVAQTQVAATQQALGVFTGTWRPVNSGIIEQLGISSAGNNQMTVSYVSRCPPDQNLCFTNSRTFTFTGVPFTPTQLAAAGSSLQMLIVPANDGRLLVTINAGGETSVQTFNRRLIIDDILVGTDLEIATRRLTNTEITTFLQVMTPGP
jgi:hypothetical protein